MDTPQPALRFDSSYSERAVLRDGSPVVFRLIRPQDKKLLADGLARMSPESRFRRFFSHRDHLSPSELAYLTELDHDRHFALGAGTPDNGDLARGLGVARFIRLEERWRAEAAVAVVDDAQGKGLGRMLFERLVRAAAERGVTEFRFEVLAENDNMLGLIESLFPGATKHVEDGIMTIDCPLPDLSAHEPGESPAGMLYDALRLAAQGAIRILRSARLPGTPSPTLKGPPPPHHSLRELIALGEDDVPGP